MSEDDSDLEDEGELWNADFGLTKHRGIYCAFCSFSALFLVIQCLPEKISVALDLQSLILANLLIMTI